jgi:hypothetical protein
MPADQGIRFHNREDAPPVDQLRLGDEHNPGRIVRTPWPHLARHVQRQLLSQEQILSGELGV